MQLFPHILIIRIGFGAHRSVSEECPQRFAGYCSVIPSFPQQIARAVRRKCVEKSEDRRFAESRENELLVCWRPEQPPTAG